MKLSTRIKKSGFLYLCADGDTTVQAVVLMVDGKRAHVVHSLRSADIRHKELLAGGCSLLPKEGPVYNGVEIIFHYTSTTYKAWCKA